MTYMDVGHSENALEAAVSHSRLLPIIRKDGKIPTSRTAFTESRATRRMGRSAYVNGPLYVSLTIRSEVQAASQRTPLSG